MSKLPTVWPNFSRPNFSPFKAFVSFKRLEKILLLSDRLVEQNGESTKNEICESKSPQNVVMKNLVASWPSTGSKKSAPFFQNINFNMPSGSFVGLIGPVGSGKSSFLSILMDEMEILEGTCESPNSQGLNGGQKPKKNIKISPDLRPYPQNEKKKHFSCIIKNTVRKREKVIKIKF